MKFTSFTTLLMAITAAAVPLEPDAAVEISQSDLESRQTSSGCTYL